MLLKRLRRTALNHLLAFAHYGHLMSCHCYSFFQLYLYNIAQKLKETFQLINFAKPCEIKFFLFTKNVQLRGDFKNV